MIILANSSPEPSCPQNGHEGSLHPPGGYHVLKRVGGGYLAVTSKRVSRWDDALAPAWWDKPDAARKWAIRNFPTTPTIIEPCDTDVAPCVLKPRRNGSRTVKVTLAELQQATGYRVGKARLLSLIADAFNQLP